MVRSSRSAGTAERRFPRFCVLRALLKGVWRVFSFLTICFAAFSGSAGKSESEERKKIIASKTAGRVVAKLGSGRWISVVPLTF